MDQKTKLRRYFSLPPSLKPKFHYPKENYIYGGFTANPIFVEILKDKLPGISIETTDFALGTGQGAGMLVND
ncbi:sugar kinase [Cecembia sp.]|uniref:sugar kinase n=1 Tax=Cecembia sp. TaxID=1898110 RepID=UPI0025BF541A|nr:sugar kinase [Cecembia sp.]